MILVENGDYLYRLAFDAAVRGSHWSITIPFGVEKLEWSGYLTVTNVEDICSHFDRIPACDRRTDRRTNRRTDILSRHSPRYAYASASRGKNGILICFNIRT